MKDLTITQAFSRLKKLYPSGVHVSCELVYDRFTNGSQQMTKRCYVAHVGVFDSNTSWRDALSLVEKRLAKMEKEACDDRP